MSSKNRINKQTWRKACVIAGVWKPNQRCDGHRKDVDGFPIRGSRCGHGLDMIHNIPYPPIGDPATTVKMLEWLPMGYVILKLMYGWCVMHIASSNREPHPTLYDALAAAIVAIGDRKTR